VQDDDYHFKNSIRTKATNTWLGDEADELIATAFGSIAGKQSELKLQSIDLVETLRMSQTGIQRSIQSL
jgi:hypothetical protein